MLVFYITCLVPFVRPKLPFLKESEVPRMRKAERENQKKVKLASQSSFMRPGDMEQPDVGIFEFYKGHKEKLLQVSVEFETGLSTEKWTGKSMFVTLYENEFQRRQQYNVAFTNTNTIQKQTSQNIPSANALNYNSVFNSTVTNSSKPNSSYSFSGQSRKMLGNPKNS